MSEFDLQPIASDSDVFALLAQAEDGGQHTLCYDEVAPLVQRLLALQRVNARLVQLLGDVAAASRDMGLDAGLVDGVVSVGARKWALPSTDDERPVQLLTMCECGHERIWPA